MICYLGVTTGVVINFHYCMEKLASAKLFDTKSKKCGKCGMHMEDADGCCRDEVKIVKMEEDQQVTVDFSYSLPSIEALTNADDRRLLAELEICQVLEKLARVRAFVDRADRLLATALACDVGADEGVCAPIDEKVCLEILATLRKL